MRREDRFVPKALEMGSEVARRLTDFQDWVDTYAGPDSPIGEEGLQRLFEFLRPQLSYVAESGRPTIRDETGVERHVGVDWLGIELRPACGEPEVRLYLTNENVWLTRGPEARFVTYEVLEPSRLANAQIGLILHAFATTYTQAAQKVQPKQLAICLFDSAWEKQAGILRVAHAFESELIRLHRKAKAAAA